MKTLLLLGSWMGFVSLCAGQQTLAEYDWRKLAESGQRLSGVVVTADGKSALKITNTNSTPLQVRLLTVSNPPVTKILYAVQGEVKYEGVQGDGFLEMWNVFPPLKPGMPEGKFFSRTLGASGEMGKISGTSDWRPFTLPFNRKGASGPPTRLELNLVLPGRGTVWLGPLKLVQFEGENLGAAASPSGAWWSPRTTGWIGGIGGTLAGGSIGLLAWLTGRGKARAFVVVTSKALMVLGGVLFVAGLFAIGLNQPYMVWSVLVCLGAVFLGVFGAYLRTWQKQYEALELRRMASVDAMGGRA